MAERATLQKQSFSSPCLLAQLCRNGESCVGFTLRRQIDNCAGIKSREPNRRDDGHSHFQDGLTLVLQSQPGCGPNTGRTSCTATSLRCQEIRYLILFEIPHTFPSHCREMCIKLLDKSSQFHRSG